MILKSFEIENNIKNILKYKFILIYGENIGLKDILKKKIIQLNTKSEIIKLYQEDINKNKDIMLNEVKNISLFADEKIIIVNQANEKIFSEIEELIDSKENIKIILLAGLLEKRSKLRNLFEKDANLAIIPCYNDNDFTLKKIIQDELREYKNLNSDIINMILTYSNLNRKNILNNLEKIKTYYDNKILSQDSLEVLLNSDRNEIFENIRDAALNGDKSKLYNLLDNFAFTNEDAYLYLNMINFRLIKLFDIYKQNLENESFDIAISKVKPPIFWKDKPIFLKLLKKWDKQRLIGAIKYLGQIEQKIKSNSNINTLTMVRNSITNICSNSWSYF